MGHLSPKHLSCHKSRTHFSQTEVFSPNHNFNPIKLSGITKYLDLGFWSLKTSDRLNQVICPEPNLWFSQTRPDFIQNFRVTSVNLQNGIIYLHQEVWGPKTSFGLSQSKWWLTKPQVQNQCEMYNMYMMSTTCRNIFLPNI